MIELKYTFSSAAELLAHLTALGAAPAGPSAKDLVAAVTKGQKADKTAEKPVTLSTAQVDAVDDTAGLGNDKGSAKTADTASTASAGDAQGKKAETSAPAIEYPVLQKAVFALAGKKRDGDEGTDTLGRRTVVELCTKFGVKTFKDLDSKRWPEALAAVEAATKQIELEAEVA